MTGIRARHFAAALLAVSLTVYNARAQEELNDNRFHGDFMPYMIAGGLSGDMTIRNSTLPVNESASDIFEHLQFGFMSRSHASYNRAFVGADILYVGLGGASSLVNVGVDQWTGEALAGYRVTHHLKAFAGARYNNMTTKFRFQGPLGTVRSGAQTWWDPFVGGQAEYPFGEVFSFSARFDAGGFGAGSRIAVNAEPLLNLHNNKHLTSSIEWKFLYQDFVEGPANEITGG
jgi:hypothetical protein